MWWVEGVECSTSSMCWFLRVVFYSVGIFKWFIRALISLWWSWSTFPNLSCVGSFWLLTLTLIFWKWVSIAEKKVWCLSIVVVAAPWDCNRLAACAILNQTAVLYQGWKVWFCIGVGSIRAFTGLCLCERPYWASHPDFHWIRCLFEDGVMWVVEKSQHNHNCHHRLFGEHCSN